MIDYKTMVKEAKAAGLTTEKTMWESIDSFSELLDALKDAHPEMYWRFMRQQHGLMHHNHYDESFALYDVAQMRYTNKAGEKMSGAHWTAEQIEGATAGHLFYFADEDWGSDTKIWEYMSKRSAK